MESNLQVMKIWQADDRTLGIEWTDGRSSRYDVVDLRRKCPCAECVDEFTRKPILKAEDVREDVRPIRIESVGRYALSIRFSDGHNTGIYTFEILRKIG